MSADPKTRSMSDDLRAARERIRDLEAKLQESEDTLEALRTGDFDAVVVQGPGNATQIYTLETADRPYRVLIEQIQEGAFTLGLDGAILYCNPRLAETLDIRQERLMGQPFADFVAEEDRNAFGRLLVGAMHDVVRGELSFSTSAGASVPMYLSLSPLERENASPLLCGVLTDLTQQRVHLRELAEANAKLHAESFEREQVEEALRQAQKMEAVGQLTGGVAHDFNNLLTVLKSSTDLLRRPGLADERRNRYLDAISDTVDRAAKLTGQLLAFARRQALKPEVFDAADRLRTVSDMLDTVTGARIRIALEPMSGACYIRADASQFETALVNMAINARDAMGSEGTLTLRIVGDAALPSIRGHAGAPGPFVAMSLSDTGSGIPADQIARIFEPFFTTKEVGKGTGLGLSQVFGFAKQSGGDVSVESTIGQGTTFTLYLPQVASVPGDSEEAPPEAASVASGGGRRVLVVEDNIEIGRFATQILEDLGYKADWVTHAHEALSRLSQRDPGFDAVFTDVVMPGGMNGVDLAREIRKLYPDLPVVLTSGYSHVLAEDGPHGFELLQKPYSAKQLSRSLSKAILVWPKSRDAAQPGGGGRSP